MSTTKWTKDGAGRWVAETIDRYVVYHGGCWRIRRLSDNAMMTRTWPNETFEPVPKSDFFSADDAYYTFMAATACGWVSLRKARDCAEPPLTRETNGGLGPEDILVNATYRAKRPKAGFFRNNDDRTVVWISQNRSEVQYDSDTVPLGRHLPKVSMQTFLRWARERASVEAPQAEAVHG